MTRMLIERFMPRYDVIEHHETLVHASASRAYDAVRHVDLARSPVVLALLTVRALPRLVARRRPASRTLTLEDLTRAGFVVLVDRPAEEIVLGLVGRFWRVTGDIRSVEADLFAQFAEPGFAKAAWNFAIEKRGAESSVVITQTRVVCTDVESRRKFLRYWRLVGPFSALIRRRVLELIKRDVERLPRASSG